MLAVRISKLKAHHCIKLTLLKTITKLKSIPQSSSTNALTFMYELTHNLHTVSSEIISLLHKLYGSKSKGLAGSRRYQS
jgi:hypothetical protein